MIDGSVLQSAQRCFEKKSRVVVKMVVMHMRILHSHSTFFQALFASFNSKFFQVFGGTKTVETDFKIYDMLSRLLTTKRFRS